MKKIVFRMFRVAMLVMAVAGVMSSCGGNSTQGEKENVDTLQGDKGANATSDLATFQLKGAVKSVAYSDDYYFEKRTFNFSKEGQLQCDSTMKVERDSLNRIMTIVFPYVAQTGVTLDYIVRFKYDEKGRVNSIIDEKQGWKGYAKLICDDQGFVAVDSTRGRHELMVTNYTYSGVDDKGNWVEREYVSRHESKHDSLPQETGSEKRVITYY